MVLNLYFDEKHGLLDIGHAYLTFEDVPEARRIEIEKESERQRTHFIATYLKDTSQKKVGRNDACPCGSGRKYKRCCGQ